MLRIKSISPLRSDSAADLSSLFCINCSIAAELSETFCSKVPLLVPKLRTSRMSEKARAKTAVTATAILQRLPFKPALLTIFLTCHPRSVSLEFGLHLHSHPHLHNTVTNTLWRIRMSRHTGHFLIHDPVGIVAAEAPSGLVFSPADALHGTCGDESPGGCSPGTPAASCSVMNSLS